MKKCIFDENKECNNCGECDTCVFDKNKICDNCGKCLELEGYDVRAIKIDEVFEKPSESNDKDTNEKDVNIDLGDFSDFDVEDDDLLDVPEESNDDEPYVDAMYNEDNWEYIDDIEGMDEMIEGIDKSDDMVERFPGLYVYKQH